MSLVESVHNLATKAGNSDQLDACTDAPEPEGKAKEAVVVYFTHLSGLYCLALDSCFHGSV